MSTQNVVDMYKNERVTRRYSEGFKLKILSELSTGKYSKSELSKFMNYRIIYIFMAMVSFLFIASCKAKRLARQGSKETVKELIVDREFSPAGELSVSIVSAKTEEDILILTLTYHGGKGYHEFDLVFNGIVLKSLPPQVNLFLKHTHTQDNCEKLITRTFKYDLKTLQMGEKGTVIIRLQGFAEKLEYNY